METSIQDRAAAVRGPRAYIGFLEWCAWACLEQRRVLMLLGAEVWDILTVFAPSVVIPDEALVCRVAAIRMTGKDTWLSTGDPNHFVIGSAPSVPLPRASSSAAPNGVEDDARRCALRHGWLLRPTIAQGDCGIDVMAHNLGLVRAPPTWLEIRTRIADFLVEHAADASWHVIAEGCQEANTHDAAARSTSYLGAKRVPIMSIGAKLGAERAESSDDGADSCEEVEASGEDDDESTELVDEVRTQVGEASCFELFVPCVEPLLADNVVPPAPEDGVLTMALPDGGTELRAEPPAGIRGCKRFAAWLRDMPPEELQICSASPAAWVAANRARELAQMPSNKAARKELASQQKRTYARSSLELRHNIAERYEAWRKGDGRDSRAPYRDFLRTCFAGFEHVVPKKDRVWLRRCITASRITVAEQSLGGVISVSTCGPRNRRVPTSVARVLRALRQRAAGLQGASYKCPELRELLWDWFVDVRASVAGMMTPRLVLQKARDIASQLLEAMRKSGHYSALPDLDANGYRWLLRWKRDKGVSLRKPNARYKCSYPLLCARLRAMWLSLIRVRHLAQRLLGRDLSDQIYGIDEKPLHFNEGGSKRLGTLEVSGAPAVRLKENHTHTHTRERVTLMTTTTSNPDAASSFRFMPLELLCKAKSPRRTRDLVVPRGMRMSFAWAPKGSYRNEHLLAWMSRYLEPWTKPRAEALDWRILMLDVAPSHIGPEVIAAAHASGYVCLYHYGCTTGVAQVNDTDLHQEFSRLYIQLEQAAFNNRQILDPSDISRRLEEVANEAAAAWRICDHMRGPRGHKFTGLSNSLDGSEDGLITREAGDMWRALDMPSERLRAMAEVDELLASGTVRSFDDWQSLVQHPPDTGARGLEGSELEGELEPGECVWLTEEDKASVAAEEAEFCKKREA